MRITLYTTCLMIVLSCNKPQQQDQLHAQAVVDGLRYSLIQADDMLQEAPAGHFSTYILRVEREDGKYDPLQLHAPTPEDYADRLKYYTYGFSHDVYIVHGADTIPCAFQHLENIHGVSPYINQILSFEGVPAAKSDTCYLSVYDKNVMERPLKINIK